MLWLVFSDPHIRNGGRKIKGLWDKKLVDGLTVLDEVIDYGEKMKVDGFICAGDFFHQRYKIDVKILHGTTEIMKRLSDKAGYFIVGNHDMYIRADVNSVFFYNLKWEVIDKMRSVADFLFIPYHKEFTDDDYKAINKECKNKIIVMHQILSGCKYQNGYVPGENEIFDYKKISGYKLLLSGHNHKPLISSSKTREISLGSVMNLDFGDSGERGCWILDDERAIIRFHNIVSPEYITLDGMPDEVDENNYYKVRLSDKDFKSSMDIPENVELVVVPKEEVVDRLELGNNFKMDDVIEKYVKLKEKPKDYAEVGIEIIIGSWD